MSEYNLTQGQIELLETIKPVSYWKYELKAYFEEDNFGDIIETFWQHGKEVEFDDFYYAGVDLTPKISKNDPRLLELNQYKHALFEHIRNINYHRAIERSIKDFVIGKSTFETTKNILRRMINMYVN